MVLSLLHLLGATGTVMFDEKADRDPDFVISSYTQGDDTYHEWTQILMYRQENQVSQIRIGPHLHVKYQELLLFIFPIQRIAH